MLPKLRFLFSLCFCYVFIFSKLYRKPSNFVENHGGLWNTHCACVRVRFLLPPFLQSPILQLCQLLSYQLPCSFHWKSKKGISSQFWTCLHLTGNSFTPLQLRQRLAHTGRNEREMCEHRRDFLFTELVLALNAA